jgi:RNA polymerase sigma-70 factor, ECF subfamily
MADEPDGDLLRRFVQGDRDAFEWLFTQFHGDVHRWSQRIVRDSTAADDVVVESFWRAYRGRARFDPSRSFGAWMRRIATNVARDHLRAARRQAASLENEPADVTSVADGSVADAIRRALGSLPPRLQIVATLALIEERPYAEIADALDVPIGTVKSRVFPQRAH